MERSRLVNADDPDPNTFGQAHQKFDFAGQELEILHQISQTISCSLDLDRVLSKIIELVVSVTEGDSCLLYLLDNARDCLVLRASKNPHPHMVGKVAMKVGEGITGWVARQGTTVAISNDAASDSRFKLVSGLPEDRYEAFLSVPIVAPAGRLIGVINVQHRRPYPHSDREQKLMSIIGHQVGAAIENARLYQEATQRSREISRLIEKGERTEQQLIERAQMLDLAADAIMVVGDDGGIVYWNNGADRLYGWSRDEAVGRNQSELLQPLFPCPPDEIRRELALNNVWHGEVRHTRRDGARIVVDSRWTLHQSAGRAAVYLQINTDITDRKRLENQLLQARKMEAIGRLTGGIAHDFNNLLTVIMGRAGLVLERSLDEKMRGDLELVVKTASRASDLTRHLLAFSRQQVLQPRIVDLNVVVQDMMKILDRILGEDIRLEFRHEQQLGAVRADPTQIGQVVLNLVVNARDAMPHGGAIAIEASNLEVDIAQARLLGVPPQTYVRLEVRDEGIGMDPEIQNKIFEPFFTTKGPGRGTGLGLATVYGIVQQSGGAITVQSEAGKGTTFTIYLPCITEQAERAPSTDVPSLAEDATILVVEDELEVRSFICETLEMKGCTVLQTDSPAEAIRICDGHDGPIHVLITDIVMPEMNGWSLSARLRRRRPGMKVIYVSGYSNPNVPDFGVPTGGAFLTKPITVQSLYGKVFEAVLNVRP